ncbi:unnamed protein product [Brugia timori]|uniref:Uncharacterized protein n=1 Tax=Brugia timori TaxID=42155 RepID=A0A0R3QYM1_9BILA|nr:unnamed protein product [Brugia timori]
MISVRFFYSACCRYQVGRDEFQFTFRAVIYTSMVLLTLIARVSDGLILATSIEGSDEVCLLEI